MSIKPLELDPTRENVYNTLVADAVGRNKNLWQFACFCSAQEGSCSIALDAGWGMGKTFFLKQLEMLFSCFDLKENEQIEIKNEFTKFKNSNAIVNRLKSHICIYYDAWLNDNAEDPMRSLLYEIINKIDTDHCFEKKDIWSRIKRRTRRFFRKQSFSPSAIDFAEALCAAFDGIHPVLPTGRIIPFLEYMKKNDPVREINAQKRFQNAFEAFLNNMIKKGNKRILIMIDELDRCKPTYAVQLLERIKHYLSNNRITFIFAVNKDQLQHTIEAFYGKGFNAYRYLDRFFDFSFSLPQPDRDQFILSYRLDQTGKDFDTRLYADVFNAFVRVYNLSLRDAARYWLWVKLACQSFKNEKEKNDDINWKFVIYIVVPILLGLKLSNKKLFDKFRNGEDPSPLQETLKKAPIANSFLEDPYGAMKEDFFDPEKINWDIDYLTENIYIMLFARDEFAEEIAINPQRFDTWHYEFKQEMIETIFSASNMMADFIKYDTNTEEPAHG